MPKTVTIAIDILLQSPLHISAMEKGRYMPGETGSRRIRRTTEQVGLPCTLTRELEINLPIPVRVGEGESAFVKTSTRVPVLPTNGLGGRIRRMAAELIMESLVARGQHLSPRAANTLMAGSPDASLDRTSASMDQVIAGKAEPYFGLFGGTSFALSEDLVTHEAYPVTESTLPLIKVTPTVQPSPRDFDLTGVVELTKKDDIKDLKNPEMLTKVVGVDAVTEYIGAIMKGREDKAAKKGDPEDQGKKTELSTVAAIQVVNPGQHFALRFDLPVRSDAHLGLLLLALKRFMTIGQHGGKAAKGYGRFVPVSSRMFEHEDGGLSSVGIELWSRDEAGNFTFSDHPSIVAAVNAGEAYIDTVEASTIERFAAADANKNFGRAKEAA